MKTIRTTAAAALLALAASAAPALPAVQAEFELSYYPPNPCIDLGVPALDGLASLFLEGSLSSRAGPSAALACSDDGFVSTFAIRLGVPIVGELAFDFAGSWALPDGGAPAFAMLAADLGPPSEAPRLVLGRFDGGIFSPDARSDWLLVAYPGSGDSRPGVVLGRIDVDVSAVPEPASGLALLAGLAALAATRRRQVRAAGSGPYAASADRPG
jgi:hypothetical protein